MADAFDRTTVYNDNRAAVDWAASCTNKGTKHLNLRENYVRELHQNNTVKITHIPGVINASDLFTKELRDAAHFRRCRDVIMVSRSNFDRWSHVTPSHMQSKLDLPYYSIRSPETLDISPFHGHGPINSSDIRPEGNPTILANVCSDRGVTRGDSTPTPSRSLIILYKIMHHLFLYHLTRALCPVIVFSSIDLIELASFSHPPSPLTRIYNKS